MTVRELIRELQNCSDQDSEVVYLEGKTYGGEEISTHIDDQTAIPVCEVTSFKQFPNQVVLR